MKRISKLIVAVLCVAFVLVGTMTIFAACGKYTLSFELGDHAASGATAPASVELEEGATTTLPQAPTAEEGWEFAGWGESKLQAGATYTMPASDTTLTAQWTEKQTTPPTPTTYTLSFELGDHAASGATAPASVELEEGATTKLPQAPTAEEGWEFAGWGESKLQAGATYTMPDSDTTLAAQWTEKQTTPPTPPATKYTLSFALGAHAASGATTPASIELEEGATTKLPQAPTAEEGWEFAGWGESKLQAGATYTMPASDTTLTAQWTEKQTTPPTPPTPTDEYTVTIEDTEFGTVDVSPKQESYAKGTQITITAIPDSGYRIYSFTVNGSPVAHTDGVYVFSIEQNVTVDVIFSEIPSVATYTLTTLVDVPDTGTIEVSPSEATYSEGTSVTVKFIPAEGYELSRFTVQGTNGTLTDADNLTYSFNITQNTTIRAFFNVKKDESVLPEYFYGTWNQINPLTDVVNQLFISSSEFRYNNTTCTVYQSVEGYTYSDGIYTYSVRFIDPQHTVLLVHMGSGNFYLYTKSGEIPDNEFPEFFKNTMWDNENMGRFYIEDDGKAILDINKLYLLYTEQDEDSYTLHILYGKGYWLLQYTADEKTFEFGQPGGKGQSTLYILVEAEPLSDEFKGTWKFVGEDGEDIVVDSDGFLHYRGEIRDAIVASKEFYVYQFTVDGNRFGLGNIDGTQFIFVFDFAQDRYELYILEGGVMPSSRVTLPDSYNGDWEYQPSDGEKLTLHIGDGAMTINGQQVIYWGEESVEEGGYIARAVFADCYWDIIISPSMVQFGSVMYYYSENKDIWNLQFRRAGSAGVTFLSTFVGEWNQLGGDNKIVIGDDTFTYNGQNCSAASDTFDSYKITGALNATVSLWEEGFNMNMLLKVETDSGVYYYEQSAASSLFPADWRGKTYTNGADTIAVDAEGNATLNGNTLRLIDYTVSYDGGGFGGFGAGVPDQGFAYDESTKTLYIIRFDAQGNLILSDKDGNNSRTFIEA